MSQSSTHRYFALTSAWTNCDCKIYLLSMKLLTEELLYKNLNKSKMLNGIERH